MLFFLFTTIEHGCFSIQITSTAIAPKSVVTPCSFYVCLEKDVLLKFNDYGKIEAGRDFGISLAILLRNCVTKQDSLPVFNSP